MEAVYGKPFLPEIEYRGRVLKPPSEFLGERIEEPLPHMLATKAIRFYESVMEKVERKFST